MPEMPCIACRPCAATPQTYICTTLSSSRPPPPAPPAGLPHQPLQQTATISPCRQTSLTSPLQQTAPHAAPCAHHLIGQDAVDAVVVQVDEPVQALHLVLAQLAAGDHRGLHLQAVARLLRAALLVAQQLLILLLLGAACGRVPGQGRGGSRVSVSWRGAQARLGGRWLCGGALVGDLSGLWQAGMSRSMQAAVQHGAVACLRCLHVGEAAAATACHGAPAGQQQRHMQAGKPASLQPVMACQPHALERPLELPTAPAAPAPLLTRRVPAPLLLLCRLRRRHGRKVLEHLGLLQQEVEAAATALRLRRGHGRVAAGRWAWWPGRRPV